MDAEKLLLSKRLRMDTCLVPECGLLADVGCDHAYASIHLVASGIAKRAVAMDVRTGPLLRAKENISRFGMGDRIEARLSDGLCSLAVSEADVILVCGMGGPLMLDILKKGWEKVCAARYIVLQPQSEIAQVRLFLHKMEFRITGEDMCEEDGKFYTAMQAAAAKGHGESPDGGILGGSKGDALPDWVFYRYGARLIAEKHPVLRKYVQHELLQKRSLLCRLGVERSGRAGERLSSLKEELCVLEKVLGLISG